MNKNRYGCGVRPSKQIADINKKKSAGISAVTEMIQSDDVFVVADNRVTGTGKTYTVFSAFDGLVQKNSDTAHIFFFLAPFHSHLNHSDTIKNMITPGRESIVVKLQPTSAYRSLFLKIFKNNALDVEASGSEALKTFDSYDVHYRERMAMLGVHPNEGKRLNRNEPICLLFEEVQKGSANLVEKLVAGYAAVRKNADRARVELRRPKAEKEGQDETGKTGSEGSGEQIITGFIDSYDDFTSKAMKNVQGFIFDNLLSLKECAESLDRGGQGAGGMFEAIQEDESRVYRDAFYGAVCFLATIEPKCAFAVFSNALFMMTHTKSMTEIFNRRHLFEVDPGNLFENEGALMERGIRKVECVVFNDEAEHGYYEHFKKLNKSLKSKIVVPQFLTQFLMEINLDVGDEVLPIYDFLSGFDDYSKALKSFDSDMQSINCRALLLAYMVRKDLDLRKELDKNEREKRSEALGCAKRILDTVRDWRERIEEGESEECGRVFKKYNELRNPNMGNSFLKTFHGAKAHREFWEKIKLFGVKKSSVKTLLKMSGYKQERELVMTKDLYSQCRPVLESIFLSNKHDFFISNKKFLSSLYIAYESNKLNGDAVFLVKREGNEINPTLYDLIAVTIVNMSILSSRESSDIPAIKDIKREAGKNSPLSSQILADVQDSLKGESGVGKTILDIEEMTDAINSEPEKITMESVYDEPRSIIKIRPILDRYSYTTTAKVYNLLFELNYNVSTPEKDQQLFTKTWGEWQFPKKNKKTDEQAEELDPITARATIFNMSATGGWGDDRVMDYDYHYFFERLGQPVPPLDVFEEINARVSDARASGKKYTFSRFEKEKEGWKQDDPCWKSIADEISKYSSKKNNSKDTISFHKYKRNEVKNFVGALSFVATNSDSGAALFFMQTARFVSTYFKETAFGRNVNTEKGCFSVYSDVQTMDGMNIRGTKEFNKSVRNGCVVDIGLTGKGASESKKIRLISFVSNIEQIWEHHTGVPFDEIMQTREPGAAYDARPHRIVVFADYNNITRGLNLKYRRGNIGVKLDFDDIVYVMDPFYRVGPESPNIAQMLEIKAKSLYVLDNDLSDIYGYNNIQTLESDKGYNEYRDALDTVREINRMAQTFGRGERMDSNMCVRVHFNEETWQKLKDAFLFIEKTHGYTPESWKKRLSPIGYKLRMKIGEVIEQERIPEPLMDAFASKQAEVSREISDMKNSMLAKHQKIREGDTSLLDREYDLWEAYRSLDAVFEPERYRQTLLDLGVPSGLIDKHFIERLPLFAHCENCDGLLDEERRPTKRFIERVRYTREAEGGLIYTNEVAPGARPFSIKNLLGINRLVDNVREDEEGGVGDIYGDIVFSLAEMVSPAKIKEGTLLSLDFLKYNLRASILEQLTLKAIELLSMDGEISECRIFGKDEYRELPQLFELMDIFVEVKKRGEPNKKEGSEIVAIDAKHWGQRSAYNQNLYRQTIEKAGAKRKKIEALLPEHRIRMVYLQMYETDVSEKKYFDDFETAFLFFQERRVERSDEQERSDFKYGRIDEPKQWDIRLSDSFLELFS